MEDEGLSRERVACRAILNQAGQAVEALAHVGVTGRQPDPRARGNRDHRPNNAAITPCRSTTSALDDRRAARSRWRRGGAARPGREVAEPAVQEKRSSVGTPPVAAMLPSGKRGASGTANSNEARTGAPLRTPSPLDPPPWQGSPVCALTTRSVAFPQRRCEERSSYVQTLGHTAPSPVSRPKPYPHRAAVIDFTP